MMGECCSIKLFKSSHRKVLAHVLARGTSHFDYINHTKESRSAFKWEEKGCAVMRLGFVSFFAGKTPTVYNLCQELTSKKSISVAIHTLAQSCGAWHPAIKD